MEKLKDLESKVRKILQSEPKARGDDDLLYEHLLTDMQIDLANVSIRTFLLNYRRMGIPTIESVGRCRRKIQEKDEALKPTPEIQLKRKQVEKSFYHYSLGMKA